LLDRFQPLLGFQRLVVFLGVLALELVHLPFVDTVDDGGPGSPTNERDNDGDNEFPNHKHSSLLFGQQNRSCDFAAPLSVMVYSVFAVPDKNEVLQHLAPQLVTIGVHHQPKV
jgi:hypothetical protein